MEATKHLRFEYIKPNLENNNNVSALDYVCNNPYRVLGLLCNASIGEIIKVQDKIVKLNKLGVKYSSTFDFSVFGEPSREICDIQNAVANISNPIYKIFWYNDDKYIKGFGSEEIFNEFFNSENSTAETEYDCFLSNYIYLVITDPQFTMTAHWEFLFKHVSQMMRLTNNQYWEIVVESKSSANESVDSFAICDTFINNILSPVYKLSDKINISKDIKDCLSLAKAINKLGYGYFQKPFEELLSTLFYFMEEWVQFKIKFIHENFLNGIEDTENPTEKELKLVDAIVIYYKNNMQQFFEDIIFKVIPTEHTCNHRIRETFHNCFHYIAVVLYYGKQYEKSRDFFYMLRSYAADDNTISKIDNEINTVLSAIDFRDNVTNKVSTYVNRTHAQQQSTVTEKLKGVAAWIKGKIGIIVTVGIIIMIIWASNSGNDKSSSSMSSTQPKTASTTQSYSQSNTQTKKIQQLKSELDSRLGEIENTKSELSDMSDELDRLKRLYDIDQNDFTVNKYNRLLEDYNSLYEDYDNAITQYNRLVNEYNTLIGR